MFITGLTKSRIRIRIKDLRIFNPKNYFKALETIIWDGHPGYRIFYIPDLDP
jgi:hypothetical protein